MNQIYEKKLNDLRKNFRSTPGQFRLKKSSVSNLFRYQRNDAATRKLSLENFNNIIDIDTENALLDVEGMATYSTVVEYTLRHGYLPLVSPELKHITVGGAVVGIGIESTCFRYGFVHDGLIEADVLLPDGNIVTCNARNEHRDLFNALPNSYGTLGYILRARIALQKALPYVQLRIKKFVDVEDYLQSMKLVAEQNECDFIEGLFFEGNRFFMMTGTFTEELADIDDILRQNIFFKLVQTRDKINLTTADYIFRYDPEWFWNIPETWPYILFRRYAPRSMRDSAFYTKYSAYKNRFKSWLGINTGDMEPLIQDWQVPWEKADELIHFCLKHVQLDGRPWAAVPIKTPGNPTLYPVMPNVLYFNLGCYCQVQRPVDKPHYYYTRIMDEKCMELGGMKMLYSSSFLTKDMFNARYHGEAYSRLKAIYDPEGITPTLYDKVILSTESHLE